MGIICKLFGHKWVEDSRKTRGYTLVEQVSYCKRCNYMRVKKQYIGSVMITIYSDELQRVEERIDKKW